MQTLNLNIQDDNETIGFNIISYDKENNSILIRPHSPLFKNIEDSYPVFNLSLSLLDKTKDLKEEIAKRIYPTIQQIIEQEKEIPKDIEEQINNLLNKKTIIDANFKQKMLDNNNEKIFRISDISNLNIDFLN
jgi:hypothetical protein